MALPPWVQDPNAGYQRGSNAGGGAGLQTLANTRPWTSGTGGPGDFSGASGPPNDVGDLFNLLGVLGAAFGAAGAFGGLGGAAGGASAGADAGAGAGTISSGAAGDIALTDPLTGVAGDAGSLAASDAAAAGLGTVPLASAGEVAGSAGMLDPLTVTAPSTAGDVGLNATDLLGASSPLLASLGASPGAVTDIGATLPSGQPSFLSANDLQPSLQSLSPDMMQQFGIDPASISTDTSFDSSLATDNPGYGPMDIADPTTGQGMESWLKNPRNLSTLASLGISGISALSKPKLPGASQTASNAAGAEVKNALPIVQSGGTATPEWASQKASIDATIDQQIQQQSAALQQAAVNSGMGGQNSGIVQQQIAEMTRQANVQRQQLYAQAQERNVQNALAELSQGDALLAQIGALQLQQEERAREMAAQTAELALLLQSGTRVPGVTGP